MYIRYFCTVMIILYHILLHVISERQINLNLKMNVLPHSAGKRTLFNDNEDEISCHIQIPEKILFDEMEGPIVKGTCKSCFGG